MPETISGFNPIFVFITYTVVWLFLFGYMFYIARRQNDVRAEIGELRQELERRRSAPPKGQATGAASRRS